MGCSSSPAARAASEPGVRRTSWSESLEAARGAAVLLVAELVGQVLAERPAEGHVDQLHPAADAEHRHVAFDGAHGERELRAVALGHQMLGRRVHVGAVAGGVDVVAAGQDQPVEQIEHLIGPSASSNRLSGGIISARPPARWIASM